MWPSFPFTCCLLFIILTHKLVVSCNFLSIRIVLSCFYLLIFCCEKSSTWMLKLSKVFLCNKVYCLGLHKSRVCFLSWFIWKGCKIFCQLEHEHSRSYFRVTRLNKLLFLFVLRKINMQCCPVALHVPPFPCFLVPPLPCFLFPLFPCSPVTLFPYYLCFLVPLSPCSPLPPFPCFLVPLFPCCPVTLFPVSLFPSSLVPLFSCYPVPLLPCFRVNLWNHSPVHQWIWNFSLRWRDRIAQ